MRRPSTPGGMNQYSVMASRGRPGTKRGSGNTITTQGGATGPPTVGLNTDIKVSYRPVTSQGLSGMQTKPLGPSRQIADKSYWLKILRDKKAEIIQEIQKMKTEAVKHNTDITKHNQMERQYEETIKEVRFLEGKLADFNLALDKLRTNTDVTEIKDTHDQLKFDNERDRKQIDALFIESKTCAEDTARMEAKIQAIHKAAADQMEELGPNFQREYEGLREQNITYRKEIDTRDEQLEVLDHKIQQSRMALKSDDFQRHEKGLALKKKLEALREQERELQEETAANLSPEDMKQKLLKKVKAANADIASFKRKIKKMKQEVQTTEEKVDKVRREIDAAKRIKEKGKKYEQLYERDDRITAFLNSFDDNKKKAMDEISTSEQTIVALMTHISKGLKWEGTIMAGKAGDVNAVHQELSFKEKQHELSQGTLSRAQADLKKRKDELAKIETLSKKITVELKALESKRLQMVEEMQSFKSVGELQSAAAKEKRELTLAREQTKHQADAMRKMIEVISQPMGRKASLLKNSELMRKIVNLEKKLSAFSQSAYQLQDFIAGRKRQSQYETLLNEAMADAERINAIIVKQLTV